MFEEPMEKKESNYACLKPADIVREQNETITKVSELFSVNLLLLYTHCAGATSNSKATSKPFEVER
jgi:hypothetical protein